MKGNIMKSLDDLISEAQENASSDYLQTANNGRAKLEFLQAVKAELASLGNTSTTFHDLTDEISSIKDRVYALETQKTLSTPSSDNATEPTSAPNMASLLKTRSAGNASADVANSASNSASSETASESHG